jgi:hypothetical protein
LYAKFEKCKFGISKVDFLRHRITQEVENGWSQGEGNFGLGIA